MCTDGFCIWNLFSFSFPFHSISIRLFLLFFSRRRLFCSDAKSKAYEQKSLLNGILLFVFQLCVLKCIPFGFGHAIGFFFGSIVFYLDFGWFIWPFGWAVFPSFVIDKLIRTDRIRNQTEIHLPCNMERDKNLWRQQDICVFFLLYAADGWWCIVFEKHFIFLSFHSTHLSNLLVILGFANHSFFIRFAYFSLSHFTRRWTRRRRRL